MKEIKFGQSTNPLWLVPFVIKFGVVIFVIFASKKHQIIGVEFIMVPLILSVFILFYIFITQNNNKRKPEEGEIINIIFSKHVMHGSSDNENYSTKSLFILYEINNTLYEYLYHGENRKTPEAGEYTILKGGKCSLLKIN